MSLNIQSILAKKASFDNLMDDYNPDIVAISETWLSSDIPSHEFFPKGYHTYRKDRVDGYSGVLLACHNNISCQEIHFTTNAEAVVSQITIENHAPLIVCAFYRPPNKDLSSIEDLCHLFTDISSTYPNIPIWITGDLNLSNINWENYSIQGTAYPSSLCDTIINFLHEFGFSQVVNFATRGNNILDVFFTNRPSLINCCYPLAGISDHEVIYIESSLAPHQQQNIKKKSFLWHKADMASIKETIIKFKEAFLSKFSLSTPVDTLWEEFKSVCLRCLTYVPTKNSRIGTKQPWITSHIR